MEPDRSHDGPTRLDRAAVRAPGRRLIPDEIRGRVAPRLDAARLAHVESVVETVGGVARAWRSEDREAALRAAWLHDAWRSASLGDTLEAIRAGGEEPDPWALRHAPILLHAQAAAAWSRCEIGETDGRVLLAVRHHPTGYPEWSEIGLALFVADFCEPTRAFAAKLDTAALVARAALDPKALAAVALEVLALRLARALRHRRAVHPDSWRAWNAWVGAGEGT